MLVAGLILKVRDACERVAMTCDMGRKVIEGSRVVATTYPGARAKFGKRNERFAGSDRMLSMSRWRLA